MKRNSSFEMCYGPICWMQKTLAIEKLHQRGGSSREVDSFQTANEFGWKNKAESEIDTVLGKIR